jgi:hypothetical protein
VPPKPCPARSAPLRLGDGLRFGREVVAEDELTDPGAFGRAADLGDSVVSVIILLRLRPDDPAWRGARTTAPFD